MNVEQAQELLAKYHLHHTDILEIAPNRSMIQQIPF